MPTPGDDEREKAWEGWVDVCSRHDDERSFKAGYDAALTLLAGNPEAPEGKFELEHVIEATLSNYADQDAPGFTLAETLRLAIWDEGYRLFAFPVEVEQVKALDPLPMAFGNKGSSVRTFLHPHDNPHKMTGYVFDPRPEYSQNEADYAETGGE